MTGSGAFRRKASGLVIVASNYNLMKSLKPFLTALALLIGAFLVISALALCVAELLVGGSL